ncbi:hypothetical protein R5R35_008357 [Gryllus longicercus]|uniref:SAC3/GANP/THP3 conserved domain-containing protein n=1 Tax=Gryllus longicercus TaxID=2509291 RepID=A0AAN9VNC2_9ORTH
MEERTPEAPNQPLIHSHSLQQTPFTQAMAARADSPSRKGGLKSHVVLMKPYDLEEMDEEDEGDEIVQEVEPPVDEPDALNDPTGIASGQYLLWSMDWGELDQERRNRKRPAVEDLPEEVREELASMSGADTEVRPKTQKPKLEIPESVKEPSRGRKSPADEVGVSDIATILSKPAKTAEERLAVLEARDKLIRIRSNQQRCPRLKNVGKCPDMCPEKERYQRIARHQVDYYEYNKETKEVNLGSMVKIYARSSADQQMPLPHDLRPVSVLWMTMSYLVNQFMDLADSPGENLGEWYHFLWDRMRSIRKDITQLALCDTLSVQILEMCARFHIFCMERLREEKMAVFDEKINRENLTKCLQSLQYMYNDLFLKNVSCPNEPEFQAYSILLHINSDLCTSTILGLRTEMRQHEKVQFAINAFLAVTMKNYVRFFKLVKSTTYLNACILHQYFAQVRAHAMLSIIRAYSRQKMRNTYPLPELQTQLLFDSIEDVLVFCRFSKVPVEDNNIVLEKTSHPIPMQEKMKRSFVGVECKRQTSIRDIVTGGCCLADTATLHKVHDSFDENGVLKQEAWYAEDQESSLLSVDLQEIGTLSKNTVVSSGPSSGLSEVSTVQEHVSHVPSSHFMVTQSSIQQTQKSVSSETQKNAFGSPRPVISSPHMPDMPFEMQRVHKSAESINVSEGESSARPLVQQSSESLNPDLGFSSEEQSSVKGFVFRIPDAKLEMKDNQAGQNSGIVPKAYASRTLQSIFGSVGSATSVNRSPGSSVLRNASSGHSVDTSQLTFVPSTSGHWVSPSQDAKTTVVCKQNSQNAMTLIDASNNMEMDSFQQMNSDNLFKSPDLVSSSPTSALQFPGSFGNRSGDFWGQSSTKTLPVSVQSFVKDSTPINPLAAKVSSTSSNQFPVSVHALPSPTSMEPSDARPSVSPLTGTQAIFPNASVQFSSPSIQTQQITDAPQKSLHVPTRAVTVSTSVFGMHSRPLTTPQTFPPSDIASSTIVSYQTTFNTPASNSPLIPGMPNADKPASAINNFSFSLNKPITITTSHVAKPSVTSSVGGLFTSDESPLNEKTSIPPEPDSESLMDLDSDRDEENNTEKLASSKLGKIEAMSPTGGRVSLPSPIRSSNLRKEPSSISKISYQEMVEKRNHRIKQLVCEIFRQWRLFAYRSKLKRRLQSQEKCVTVTTKLSLEEQVHELPMPKGCVAVDYQTRLEHLLDLEEIKLPTSVFPDIPKIRLENVLSTVLPKVQLEKGNLETNMFWKLCLSLPSELEGKKFGLQLDEWIAATFCEDSDNDILRINRTPIGEKYNLFTSVQRTVGVVKEVLKGVNGLLFFAPQRLRNKNNAFERYQSLVQSSSPQEFPLPIVAIISNSQWVEVCQKWFTSDVQKKRIAAFKIIGPFGKKSDCVSKELIDGISWLTQYIRPSPPFEYWLLKEVFLMLMRDLWTRVRFSLACRCSSGFVQHPDDLLHLYNDALRRLHRMIANDKMHDYGDVAPELEDLAKHSVCDKYNCSIFLKNPEYCKQINDGFSQVQLNICVPPSEKLSVESFCEAVYSYNPRLRGPIYHFLRSWNKDEDVDWTFIVESLTELHIRETIGKLKLWKLVVVFMKNDIQKFRSEPWYAGWLLDRLPNQKHSEEVLSDKLSPAVSIDSDLSVAAKEVDVPSVDDDEKLLSDFESMLNALDELKKADLKHDSNLSEVFSPSDSKDQNKCIQIDCSQLDILESQLEYYAKILKD